MTVVTFYHSAVCPRCQLASVWLNGLLENYPHVSVERVELLTNRRAATAAGVRSIPTLVAGEQSLSGFVLTRSAIQRFLDSLEGRVSTSDGGAAE